MAQQQTANIETELARRHRKALTFIAAMFALTVLLVLLSFGLATRGLASLSNNPTLDGALRIAVVLVALGAVALRRTMFAPMRLRDIAGVKGIPALLATLERTTMRVAALGGLIAVIGFALSMLEREPLPMLLLGLAAAAVLLYAYPRKTAWLRLVRALSDDEKLTANALGANGSVAKGTSV